MQILGCHSRDIFFGDLLDPGAVSLKKVGRITVKLVGHTLAHDLGRGIEGKDEGIEDGIFGALDFGVVDGIGFQFVDLGIECLNRFYRALALGAHTDARQAGMIPSCTYAAAYVIGQPQLRANVREQSRGEAQMYF